LYSKNINPGGDKLKQWTIRMPEEVFDWLREKAARETINRKRSVSMNAMAVQILTKAMRSDKKKGGR
jgi:hypothetical protein